MRHRDGYKSIVASACCLAALLAGSAARAAADPPASRTIPGIPGGPPLTQGETPEETYQLNFVGLEHRETGGYIDGRQVSKTESWMGFRGKYRLKLGPIEFYDAVARHDLHDKARNIVIATTACLAGGVALALGGGIYGLTRDNSSGPPKGAILAVFGGVGLMAIALMLRFETVPEAEAYKMARTYNDRLRVHLGLPPIVEDPTQPHASVPPPRPERRRVSLVPAVSPQGGGLLVVGSF
jgi:hypothetical protein